MKISTLGLLSSIILLSACTQTKDVSVSEDTLTTTAIINQQSCLDAGGSLIKGSHGNSLRDVQCSDTQRYLGTFQEIVGGDVVHEYICCK